jgi:Na+/proline symporter
MVGLKGFLVELRGGTCLPLALFMVFNAKWHRRAGVMTVAEWMEFRFGSERGASAARLVSAFAIVLMVLGMMTYFCVGFGKFLAEYFPFTPMQCATFFTIIAAVHILASGLYGVAFTDLFQGVLVLLTVLFITYLALTATPDPQQLRAAWETLGNPSMTWERWTSILPSWTMEFPAAYGQYSGFGVLLIFWILRIFLEGFGGPLIPYATQRFFAARDDRDASLTTAASLTLFVIRWPLIVGVALLGLSLGAEIPTDPELVFPAVLRAYFPLGLRAVVVSCMVAAAMSTFDSTVNAGGAYIVNDLYRRFLRPEASTRQLVRVSMASTVVLTAICLLLATQAESINAIWSWLSMGLFGGLAGPLVLRWYWERFNGWGYAIGTIVGILGAVIQKGILPDAPEWAQLAFVGGVGTLASVIGSLVTAPTDPSVLAEFYRRTRPMGGWPIARAALPPTVVNAIRRDNRRDLLAVLPAVAGFFFLFLSPMYLIIGDGAMSSLSLLATGLCAMALYLWWYRPISALHQETES